MTLTGLVFAAFIVPCIGLGHGVLHLPTPTTQMDPSHPALKKQLMALLGARAMNVAPLSANVGLNGGMWVLSEPRPPVGRRTSDVGPRPSEDLVVKMRPVGSDVSALGLSEAEHLALIAKKHPGIDRDPFLAFPSAIFACVGPEGRKQGDAIVTRKVRGQTLAQYIWEQHNAGPAAKKELNPVFEQIGRQLRAFHLRYGTQHSDFQAANIMVDPADNHRVTFIDLAGMGLPILDNDLMHFAECMRLLSQHYPPAWLQRGHEHFLRAYNAPVPTEAPPSSHNDGGVFAAMQGFENSLTWTGVFSLFTVVYAAPFFARWHRARKTA